MDGIPGYDAWKTRSDRDDAEMHGNYDEADRPTYRCKRCGAALCLSDIALSESPTECPECGGPVVREGP